VASRLAIVAHVTVRYAARKAGDPRTAVILDLLPAVIRGRLL